MAATIRVVDDRRKLNSSPISKLGEDDLLIEVLIRLPGPKSAFRCKPVCKLWNSLISTRYFSRRFISHHRTLSAAAKAASDEPDPPVLTLSKVRESIVSFLPFPDHDYIQYKFSVLDTVKDLHLIGFWGPENDQELRRTHLVCNPFTKKWVALPLAPKMSARNGRYRWIVKLVCEPPNSHGQDALGVEDWGFRVVRMYDPFKSGSSEVDVYLFCLRCGSGWMKLVLRLDDDLRCYYRYRVVSDFDGKLYWLNRRQEVVKWDPFCRDLGARPALINGSKFVNGHIYGPWFSEGALHVVCMDSWDRKNLSVWRLEDEEGGGWRKIRERDYDGIEILDLRVHNVIGLHAEKSEIVYLSIQNPLHYAGLIILSWDLTKREPEFLTHEYKLYHRNEEMFQPKIALWPSLISSHEKLQNAYNGSYNCWLPRGSQSTS